MFGGQLPPVLSDGVLVAQRIIWSRGLLFAFGGHGGGDLVDIEWITMLQLIKQRVFAKAEIGRILLYNTSSVVLLASTLPGREVRPYEYAHWRVGGCNGS